MQNQEPKANLFVRIPVSLDQEFRELVQKNDRTLTKQVERLLREAINKDRTADLSTTSL